MIKKIFIVIYSLFLVFGCSPIYLTSSPYLIKISKPNDFKDISYDILDNNTYIFSSENMEELLRQFDWCSSTVEKYEKQIDVVNKYQNKEKEKGK